MFGHLLTELFPLAGSWVTHSCSANVKLHCAPAVASHKWSGRCESEENPRNSSILIRRVEVKIEKLCYLDDASHKQLEMSSGLTTPCKVKATALWVEISLIRCRLGNLRVLSYSSNQSMHEKQTTFKGHAWSINGQRTKRKTPAVNFAHAFKSPQIPCSWWNPRKRLHLWIFGSLLSTHVPTVQGNAPVLSSMLVQMCEHLPLSQSQFQKKIWPPVRVLETAEPRNGKGETGLQKTSNNLSEENTYSDACWIFA